MDPVPALVPPRHGDLHVLQVVGNGIVGGMETCVRRLIERLSAGRFRFTVLLPYECELADELRALHAQVCITAMPEEPSWDSIQGTCALIQASGVDVLHAHLPSAHALAGIAGHLSARPVLATIHGRQLTMRDLEVHRTTGTHLHMVCAQSYRHALGVGVDPERLTCIVNGVDTDQFAPPAGAVPGQRSNGPLRRELGVAAEAPLIGFVGRLSLEKGPEVFVRMAQVLHAQMPEAHFVMCGDGPMRPALLANVKRLGLQQQLHFAGERAHMPSVLDEMDLLVASSFSEAMPLAQMEAMASGLPVVTTNVGGVPELIEHRRTGWLVESGNAEGLASAVALILGTTGLREAMGMRARQRVKERFSIEASERRTAQLLERLHVDAVKRNGNGGSARRSGAAARAA